MEEKMKKWKALLKYMPSIPQEVQENICRVFENQANYNLTLESSRFKRISIPLIMRVYKALYGMGINLPSLEKDYGHSSSFFVKTNYKDSYNFYALEEEAEETNRVMIEIASTILALYKHYEILEKGNHKLYFLGLSEEKKGVRVHYQFMDVY